MINNSMRNCLKRILIVDNMIVVCYIHMIVLKVQILMLLPYRNFICQTPFIKN